VSPVSEIQMPNEWFSFSSRLGVGVIVTMITTPISFLVWIGSDRIRARLARRRMARTIRDYTHTHPDGTVALILSAARDIEPDVRRHLESLESTRTMPVFRVHHEGGFTSEEGAWQGFIERARTELRLIAAGGPKRIWLFCNLPIGLGVALGTFLLPGPEVLVHHFQDNTYRPLTLLNTQSVKL